MRWVAVGIGVLYVLFAVAAAAQAAAGRLGLTGPTVPSGGPRERAVPWWFVAHALTGAIALLAVVVQLCVVGGPATAIRRQLHRLLGRWYVGAALFTSALSVPVVRAADRGIFAQVAFLGEAALWFVTTVGAYLLIRAGRARRHREWMVRSASLAAFFVTFSLWDPAATALADRGALPIGRDDTGGLAVLLGWSVNLVAAEVWIRRDRRAGSHA